ncbi:hypothetical protein TWF970_009788 [Orbilia oligospora]|uniref:Uncharacterized protein n=1 Tax=Orbilia oligospora TaxID=2813651 RepID=A0A7C8VEP9_ORBOL|nr:hypothetical protein TWF970_009788 [Orbilia oligospora]
MSHAILHDASCRTVIIGFGTVEILWMHGGPLDAPEQMDAKKEQRPGMELELPFFAILVEPTGQIYENSRMLTVLKGTRCHA